MLTLRPYKKCDAQHIVSWITDERVFRMWCADRFDSWPISADDLNSAYDALAYDDFFAMTAVEDGSVVGQLTMRYSDNTRGTVHFGFIIIDSFRRGTGLGRRMVSLALRYAFDILNVQHVTLGVFDCNTAAQHCYAAAGFRESGVSIGQYSVFGEVWNRIELEVTADSWRERK